MDGYAHQLRELYELAGIPPVSDALMRELADSGRRLLDAERKRHRR